MLCGRRSGLELQEPNTKGTEGIGLVGVQGLGIFATFFHLAVKVGFRGLGLRGPMHPQPVRSRLSSEPDKEQNILPPVL